MCWDVPWWLVYATLFIELGYFILNVCILEFHGISLSAWIYFSLIIHTGWLVWYLIIILAFINQKNDCAKLTPTIFTAHTILFLQGILIAIAWTFEIMIITCAWFCGNLLVSISDIGQKLQKEKDQDEEN